VIDNDSINLLFLFLKVSHYLLKVAHRENSVIAYKNQANYVTKMILKRKRKHLTTGSSEPVSLKWLIKTGGLPMNTVILFVPQQEAWIVERFGKYQRVLQPVCIIVLDKFSIQILNSQIVKNVSEQIVTFFK
jgi:hypothetical protein